MRWVAVAAFVMMTPAVPAVAQVAAGTAPPNPLHGTWESIVRSTGGIGRAFTFAADGSALNAQLGMTPDARYVYDGTRLRVSEADGATSTDELTIRGDTLVWGTADHRSTFVRIRTGADAGGIVGRWASARGQPPGYLVFTRDGIMQARVILESMAGTHSVNGDRLILTFAGRSITFTYGVVADTLVLTPRSGRRERYVRGR